MAIAKVIYKTSAEDTGTVWMDTTQKTVTAGTMLSGTTALKNDGTDVTGNIASKSSSDLTASNLTVSAPAGYYASAASKTLSDENLTAGNIKKDVTIFGTTGTYEGGSATLITKSITANGTYNASSDNADGYSSVTVNVSGGGGTVEPKDVNFIDYDGTLVASKTKAEINAMTSDADLPANPSHTGLTAQGWNWTVAQLKAQLLAMPDDPVTVGQMYITSSGKTEIDVTMQDGRLSPILTIAVNGTVTVDWGDNTTADTVTGTSLTSRKDVSHTYASAGDYTIFIGVTSGSFTFYGSTSYLILRKNTKVDDSRVYANCVKAVRLGSGIASIGQYAFYYCSSLSSITIPSNVTSISNNAFQCCYYLASITIPSGVTSISNTLFYYCYSLASITIPSGVTSIGASVFSYCYSLASITIPSGVTSIGNNAFTSCYSLASITIPSGVTSIGTSVFTYCYSLASLIIQSGITSISNNAFQGCYSLASITIPSVVTSIGNSAFSACCGMAEYHFKPTTVPTFGTTVFNGIVSDCIIYVPSSKLTDYKNAGNMDTYASYMQGE